MFLLVSDWLFLVVSGWLFQADSNRSALTSGIEWNYRFNNSQDSQNFKLFYETFEDLFKNHSYVIDDAKLKAYSKNWHKPAVAKDLARYDQTDPDTKVEVLFQPRGAQIEALCALENSRAEVLRVVWFMLRLV